MLHIVPLKHVNTQTFIFHSWCKYLICFAFPFILCVNRSCFLCYDRQILCPVDLCVWEMTVRVNVWPPGVRWRPRGEEAYVRRGPTRWRCLAMALMPRRSALLYGPRPRAAASASFYPVRWHPQSVSTAPGRPPEHTMRTLMSLKTLVCLYLLFRGRVVPHYRKLRPDEEEWAIYYLWHLLSPLRERERKDMQNELQLLMSQLKPDTWSFP